MASLPMDYGDSTLDQLTSSTTQLLQFPIPDEEGYQERNAAKGADGMLSQAWPVADFLSKVSQDSTEQSTKPGHSAVSSGFERLAQKSYMADRSSLTSIPLVLSP
ncbi:hypothetical protein I316_00272 [Kwoniella heveanensis BCC8398]|uniref:Uncharacterized protein n=1 Tax=Kwoniella heveanensis BCC8398 TaxID=1296120 RepID=A0A1B9H460_9TREE|nr:hypothetical protein I316_00272 [Kwoniella heveanensis BCC8398]